MPLNSTNERPLRRPFFVRSDDLRKSILSPLTCLTGLEHRLAPRPERDLMRSIYQRECIDNAITLRLRSSRSLSLFSLKRVLSPSSGDEKGTRFQPRSTV